MNTVFAEIEGEGNDVASFHESLCFEKSERSRLFSRKEIREIAKEAFSKGASAMGDLIHQETAGVSSVPYPRALEMLSDLESSEDWRFRIDSLLVDSGVRLMAQLYGVPVAKVAADLADLRKRQIQKYLSERGHG